MCAPRPSPRARVGRSRVAVPRVSLRRGDERGAARAAREARVGPRRSRAAAAADARSPPSRACCRRCARAQWGYTARDKAQEEGESECVALLDGVRGSAAERRAKWELHTRLLAMSEPPVLQAAQDGDAAALRQLIDAGGNVNERNEVRAPPSRSPKPSHALPQRGEGEKAVASRALADGARARACGCCLASLAGRPNRAHVGVRLRPHRLR